MWFDSIRKRVEDVLKELKLNENEKVLEQLRTKAAQFLPEHGDR